MSFRGDLTTATAQLGLDVLTTLGDTGTYSNRGATGITVYLHPESESQELAQALGCDINETARRFLVAKQTSFPPTAGVAASDTVTYPTSNGVVYNVKTWKDISGGLGSLFALNCVRSQARRAGV